MKIGMDFFTDTSIKWPWYVARTAVGRQATGTFIWALTYLIIYRSQPIQSYAPLTGRFVCLALFTSPIVETFEMAGMILILKTMRLRPMLIAVLVGLSLGIQHIANGLPTMIATMWGFFIYALCFMAWQEKSLAGAFLITAAVHSASNLFRILQTVVSIGLYGPDWNVYPIKCYAYLFKIPFILWGMR